MVVFDTSTIVYTIDPQAKPPVDPGTGLPLSQCKERIEFLIAQLSVSRTRILLPTPVISEFLIKAGPNKQRILDEILASRNFLVGSFELRAAVELACLLDEDLKHGSALSLIETKAKVRFDRQIIAIARVYQADTVYTDDGNLASFAERNLIKAVMTWQLPLPPVDPQITLFDGDHVPD